MLLLGIDYGEKYTGIALSREGVILPVGVWDTDADLVQQLREYCQEKKIQKVIWGLPLGVNREENHICEAIRRKAKKLAEKTRLPYDFINERYSTSLASAQEKQAPKTNRKDDLAAMKILEFYQGSNRGTKE